ncbi:hypothetical protein HRbin26_01275 [bacterium HR26]|nr:hypothetical protein HRbin26_01275 [bacterium HR26]
MAQTPHERHESVREYREGPAAYPGGEEREHYEHVVQDVAAEHNMILERIAQLIWTLTGILLGLITLRILLKLIAANPGNDFVRIVYDITDFFVAPFVGITANPTSGSIELDVAAIIAMIVYALAAWAIVRPLWVLFARSSARNVSRVDRTVTREDEV